MAADAAMRSWSSRNGGVHIYANRLVNIVFLGLNYIYLWWGRLDGYYSGWAPMPSLKSVIMNHPKRQVPATRAGDKCQRQGPAKRTSDKAQQQGSARGQRLGSSMCTALRTSPWQRPKAPSAGWRTMGPAQAIFEGPAHTTPSPTAKFNQNVNHFEKKRRKIIIELSGVEHDITISNFWLV